MSPTGQPRGRLPGPFLSLPDPIAERYLDSQSQEGPVESIPLIVPVLLYQGPEGWTMPRRLSELFDIPPHLAQSFASPIELVFDVESLERLLERRDFPLTHELRQRIAGCEDENLLLRWFDRAVTATALAEIFDD